MDGLGDHHADRVGQPPSPLSEPGDELVGAAAGIAADQRLASPPMSGVPADTDSAVGPGLGGRH